MAHVNLWEVMTDVASLDKQTSGKCKELQAVRNPRFGTELSLDIDEKTGIWTVVVFDHEDHEQYVKLAITPMGDVKVSRGRRPLIAATKNEVYRFNRADAPRSMPMTNSKGIPTNAKK